MLRKQRHFISCAFALAYMYVRNSFAYNAAKFLSVLNIAIVNSQATSFCT